MEFEPIDYCVGHVYKVTHLTVWSRQRTDGGEETEWVEDWEDDCREHEKSKLVESCDHAKIKHNGCCNCCDTSTENTDAHFPERFSNPFLSIHMFWMSIMTCKMHHVINCKSYTNYHSYALTRAQLPPHIWNNGHNVDNDHSYCNRCIKWHQNVTCGHQKSNESEYNGDDQTLFHCFYELDLSHH